MADLRLDSYAYKQQPTLSRSSYSHVDNEGVKALVDGICHRWSQQNSGERTGGTPPYISFRWGRATFCAVHLLPARVAVQHSVFLTDLRAVMDGTVIPVYVVNA